MSCGGKCGVFFTVSYRRLRINQLVCSVGDYFPWHCPRILGLSGLGSCISQAEQSPFTLDASHVLGLSGLGWPTSYVPMQGGGGGGEIGSGDIG